MIRIIFYILGGVILVIGIVFFLRFYFSRQVKDSLFEGSGGSFFRETFIGGVLGGLLGLRKSGVLSGEQKDVDFGSGDKESISSGENHKGGEGSRDIASGAELGVEKIRSSRKRLEASIGKHSGKKSVLARGKGSLSKGEGGKDVVSTVSSKANVNVSDALKSLQGTSLGSIISSLKEEQRSIILKKINSLRFESRTDFLNALIEELISLLQEANKELGYRLSKLRKKGVSVRGLSLKLMSVPLKIILFKSTLSQKDFTKVLDILSHVEEELIPFEKRVLDTEEKKES